MAADRPRKIVNSDVREERCFYASRTDWSANCEGSLITPEPMGVASAELRRTKGTS
ncbi:uncharacterized protein PHALS_01735 [Plasmopara halstedii]|uniref:Uncharacterized protein n=1 Tax=Plasmopara halstedii TaxID=4781 RepID=A0A0P1ATE0_PLAHL|nr:uncharacterized protein PHALS_01735 [Plasmopara halstedii]CEG45441.1 hypothetical protein PHALS_01735 [Plasmopara halstedii]|eukprot:XP_024581810.1 hypothetical protein PHALS_01735 [Plasmopara halstedii]